MALRRNRETFLPVKGSRGKNPADNSLFTAIWLQEQQIDRVCAQLFQNGELCEHSCLSGVDTEYPADVLCEHFLVEAGLFK